MFITTARASFLSFALTCLAAPLQAQQNSPATSDRAALIARIDSLAMAYLADGRVPSAAVAVVRGRDTLVMRGYGLADVETKRPAGPGTVYEIGSITKQFTSAAIMRLVEQGKISLDDDMSKYLPKFPLQGHHVTIRQLLNHTSGIHSYTSSAEWRKTWAQDISPDGIVDFVAKDTFDFAPGSKWSYNNTGYVLLGMILEKVTGKPYATLLDEQFFKPLGLKQTTYCPSRTSDTTFARGYSYENGRVVPAAYLSLTHPFSAGALCSTVRDYLVWQRALHGGRIVSAKSYQLMTTPDTLTNGRPLTYGFGLSVGKLGSHPIITHGGGINGFTTAQLYVPDDTLSVIVFTNSDGRGPDGTAANIANAVLGLPLVRPPVRPPVVALDAAERDKLVGVYDLKRLNGGTLTINVFLEGDRLMSKVDAPGQGTVPLLHYGNNVFGAEFDPSLRLTFISENGKVTTLRLQQSGNTIEGPRRP